MRTAASVDAVSGIKRSVGWCSGVFPLRAGWSLPTAVVDFSLAHPCPHRRLGQVKVASDAGRRVAGLAHEVDDLGLELLLRERPTGALRPSHGLHGGHPFRGFTPDGGCPSNRVSPLTLLQPVARERHSTHREPTLLSTERVVLAAPPSARSIDGHRALRQSLSHGQFAPRHDSDHPLRAKDDCFLTRSAGRTTMSLACSTPHLRWFARAEPLMKGKGKVIPRIAVWSPSRPFAGAARGHRRRAWGAQ